MPHQTIPVGEQLSDATLELLNGIRTSSFDRTDAARAIADQPRARSRSSEMRGDGREEETPNKKLRSHRHPR